MEVLDKKKNGLTLLEISSGCGEHVSHFAPHFKNIIFQPSEFDASMLNSIKAYIKDCPTNNICQPMEIDIRIDSCNWGQNPASVGPFLMGDNHINFRELKNFFDYMLNINMLHISPIDCAEGLFRNAATLLKSGGLLLTYGPYANDGVLEPESNVQFDAMLRSKNPQWGVRDIVLLQTIASKYGINFIKCANMPANNKFIIWQKEL